MDNTKSSAKNTTDTGAGTSAPAIIVYSTPDCQYCGMAKTYLLSKGLKFADYDVGKDKEKAKEMVEKSGQGGVPVIDINHRIIIGFDRQLIDDALTRKPPAKREDIMNNPAFFDPFNH